MICIYYLNKFSKCEFDPLSVFILEIEDMIQFKVWDESSLEEKQKRLPGLTAEHRADLFKRTTVLEDHSIIIPYYQNLLKREQAKGGEPTKEAIQYEHILKLYNNKHRDCFIDTYGMSQNKTP